MKQIIKIVILYFVSLCSISAIYAPKSDELSQLNQEKKDYYSEIQNRTALYSKYLLDGDSVAIAGMYSKDGKIGGKKGSEILATVGSWIRSNFKNDSRHVNFKTVTLNRDKDLLIETGITEAKNDQGELKYSFRYLVVWKMEEGVWKLYRDVVL